MPNRSVALTGALTIAFPGMMHAQRLPVPQVPAPATTAATTAATAPATTRTRIVGSVWDSVAMKPLGEAIVRMVRADDPAVGMSATTTMAGRFAFDSVPTGTWLATFLHPVLDSMRVEPGVMRLEITEPGEVRLPLATPSARTLIGAGCRAVLTADLGMIAGEVRRADDDTPLIGAQVFVEWPEWVLQRGRMSTEMRRLTARTDSSGRYALCGVPAGSSLRTIAWFVADTTGAIEVAVPDAGFTTQDFVVGTSEQVVVPVDTAATAATDTASASANARAAAPRTVSAITNTARRGRAAVRGQVRTLDGRPIANAIVRVLGSGSQVRSGADGAFLITDAATGTQSIEARAIGYAAYRMPVALRTGETGPLHLRLAVQRVQLDTVRVVAGRQLVPEVRAIERRMSSGVGTFLDAKTVRERSTVFVTDALRGIPGVQVSQSGGNGQEILMRRNVDVHGSFCIANIIVDGQRMPQSASAGTSASSSASSNATLDDYVNLGTIAAIEVYARPNTTPPEFLTTENQCGVVVVWTRRGTGGVMPQRPKPNAP